jgi:hypothetical protein
MRPRRAQNGSPRHPEARRTLGCHRGTEGSGRSGDLEPSDLRRVSPVIYMPGPSILPRRMAITREPTSAASSRLWVT